MSVYTHQVHRRACVLAALIVHATACPGDSGDRSTRLDPAQAGDAEQSRASGLLDLGGAPFDLLGADDRIDLIIFMRTDCPISNRYAPTYQRLSEGLRSEAIDLWRVYVDPDESAEMIRTHALEYSLPGRALRDPQQMLARKLGVGVTPEAALIAADGELVYRGRIDDWYADYGKPRAQATKHELRDALTAVLDGQLPRVRSTDAVGCPLPPLVGAEDSSPAKSPPEPPLPGADGVVPERVTFTEHVAPIVHARCSSCHRPDQVAPFALLDEADVRDHAEQIVDVTESRYMPPWKPVQGHGEFEGDRSLTPAQVKIFASWLDAGLPSGPEAARKAAPLWSEGWQGGTPDLIVELSASYTVEAEGLDIYRNFVFPPSAHKQRWIRAWELDPGNPRVVHHAILNLDSGNWAKEADEAAPGLGFEAMETQGIQGPGGSYLVWAPGLRPTQSKHSNAWPLSPGTSLVLQLHLQPTGKPETVSPRVGLYFGERPARTGITVRVGDVPIDIAAGDDAYFIEDSLVLAAEVEVLSVFPHAHYLARTFDLTALSPSGATTDLLRIDDWDFSWQEQYRYREPVRLAAGTVLKMRIGYDNSAENPRNPSHPPKRVKLGPNSLDEMGNLTFELVPQDKAGLLALREAKYRRAISRGAGAKERFNLGNVLRDSGDLSGAVDQYELALNLDPDNAWALHNLSMLLQHLGRSQDAVQLARRAVELQPDSASALNNLGNALRGMNQPGQAIEAFRAALVLDPNFQLARNNLSALGVSP